MKIIAKKIRKQLQQPPNAVPAFVDETDLAVGCDAPHRLKEALFHCKVAVVLFCDDFFSSPCCDAEARVVAEHGAVNKRFQYLPVFYTNTSGEVAQQAREAWSAEKGPIKGWEKYTNEQIEEFIGALTSVTGVRHKQERNDGINISPDKTITRICQEVKQLLQPTAPVLHEPAAAAAAAGHPQPLRVAFPVGSAQQGPAGPAVWPVLVASEAASTMGPVLVALGQPAQTPWLQPPSSCVFIVTSSSLLLKVGTVAAVTRSIASMIVCSRVAARHGCVTCAVELPPHASGSPQQLLGWAQQLSGQLAAADSAAQGCVTAACGAGGLVAWCQQGWGVCLPPTAADLPRLVLSGSRVLSAHGQCNSSSRELAALDIRWQGAEGPTPQLLIKQGPELHAVPLPRTAAGGLDPAACSAEINSRLADILTDMFAEEGLLLLSACTGQYFSSTPEPVLVLDVDEQTAAQLNSMATDAGSLVLSWLHTLLLQPDSQLRLLWTTAEGINGSPAAAAASRSSSSSSSSIAESILAADAGEFDASILQQLQQQLLEPGSDLSVAVTADLRPWLPHDTPPQQGGTQETGSTATQPAIESAAAEGDLLAVKLAAVRARAAYALLAVAIQQKQLLAVRWLLARLTQQRAWLTQGHCTAEATLVAQQRIAWSGMLPRFQQPLLLLATATGDKAIIQELSDWSTHHNLPTRCDQLGPLAAALTATLESQAAPAGGWNTLGLACLDDPPPLYSNDNWRAVASVPGMLQADSLEELASVLGPEGDLSVAVLGGSPQAVQGVLAAGQWSQQQLDEALELSALLGGDTIEMLPPLRDMPSSSSTSSAKVGNLAVAAWCLGLHDGLSWLRRPKAPQPRLQSLQQFLRDTTDPQQRTVGNLLAQLQMEYPELLTAESLQRGRGTRGRGGRGDSSPIRDMASSGGDRSRSPVLGSGWGGRTTDGSLTAMTGARESSSSSRATPIQAWPWFQTAFCQDEHYRPPTHDMTPAATTIVPWHHFWTRLHKLAISEGLNEVWWAFDDHQLAQPSQRQVFQDNLWGRVGRPSSRDNITAAEFKAAVDLFSSGAAGGGLADLIESIMKDTPGSRADSTLRLRDQVFLCHTGADRLLGSVSLTSAIYHKLRNRWQVVAFYDTHTLEPDDDWRAKIERCVRSSKFIIVVLSPGFFTRYWCMHELDLALHADPEPAGRIIMPVLLGVDHGFAKDARAKYRQKWQAFTQLSGRPDVEQVLERWEQNLQQLDGKQGLDAAVYGAGADKQDWESKLVPVIADKVLLHVAPCAGWKQDPLQPQQRQRHVHDLLPDHLVTNAAALERLRSSIEAACKRQAEAMQQPGSAAAAGRQPVSSPRAVPPPVVQLLGMAGMGKSVLALQTAYYYQDTVGCFNGTVHFLRVPPQRAQLDDKAAVSAAVVQLQRTLLKQLQPDAATNATTPDELHLALTNAFASANLQRQTHLVVLDDVWHKDFIQQLRCSTMRGVILVTSRMNTWDDNLAADSSTVQLQADPDSREAARALMMDVLQEAHGQLSAGMLEVVDEVLCKCDGNMLATALMAGALKGRSSTAAWQVVCKQTMQRLEAPGAPIISAIQAALDSLAADIKGRKALKAFDMLRHVQGRLMLPLPLLQLLWMVLHPSEAHKDVGVLLDHLLQSSLVYRQQDDGKWPSFYTHAVTDEVLAGQTPDVQLPAAPTGSWAAWACSLIGKAAPPTTASLNKLAVLLLGFGRPPAVTWAQQLLGVQPVDGQAITYLGVLQDEVLQRPVTDFAQEPTGQLNRLLGMVFQQDGQYGKAVACYRCAKANFLSTMLRG